MIKNVFKWLPIYTSFRLQVASDLHLDVNPPQERKNIIKPNAPYLALAGDIAEMRNSHILFPFLTEMCHKFEKVFYVMGNHEYYAKKFDIHSTKEKLLETLRNQTKELSNLFILDQETHYLEKENILIAGCTLWTDVPIIARESVSRGMNDYKKICLLIEKQDGSLTKQRMTIDDTNGMHHQCMNFLREAKKSAIEKSAKMVIITHHAPLTKGTSNPIHEDPSRKLSRGYSTDLSQFIVEDDLISAWIFGHTHWSCDFSFGKTRIFSNASGYIGIDCQETPYRKDAVLEITN